MLDTSHPTRSKPLLDLETCSFSDLCACSFPDATPSLRARAVHARPQRLK
jgi:hypothetical protein